MYGLEENANILRNVLAILEQYLLKYSRQASCEDTYNLTQNLAETFLQSFPKYSDLGQKIVEPISPQPCRNISRKIARNVA